MFNHIGFRLSLNLFFICSILELLGPFFPFVLFDLVMSLTSVESLLFPMLSYSIKLMFMPENVFKDDHNCQTFNICVTFLAIQPLTLSFLL
jgi:hypothetical protein